MNDYTLACSLYINANLFQRKVIDYLNTKCFSEILVEPSCIEKN